MGKETEIILNNGATVDLGSLEKNETLEFSQFLTKIVLSSTTDEEKSKLSQDLIDEKKHREIDKKIQREKVKFVEELLFIIKNELNLVSLDSEFLPLDGSGDEKFLIENIKDSNVEDIVIQNSKSAINEKIKKIIQDQLKPREERILKFLYVDQLSGEDIAKKMGVSREAIKQNKDKTLKKIRMALIQEGFDQGVINELYD